MIIRCEEKPAVLFVPKFGDHQIRQPPGFDQIIHIARYLIQHDQTVCDVRIVFYISVQLRGPFLPRSQQPTVFLKRRPNKFRVLFGYV